MMFLGFSACTSARFISTKAEIQLKGNPTTGYTWLYEVGDEAVIQIDEDVKYLGSDGVVGAPSLFTYTITSLKPGKTALHFEYRRPWETVPAAETHGYEVSVDENGGIEVRELHEDASALLK